MKRIPLTQRQHAMVSDEDYAWLMAEGPWCAFWTPSYSNGGNFRAARWRRKEEEPGPRTVFMHRRILGLNGERSHVDHIDRNPLNNQRSNLRTCTPRGNSENRSNQSRYGLGVWMTRHKKFAAYATVGGRLRYLGTFRTPQRARQHRKIVIEELESKAGQRAKWSSLAKARATLKKR